MRKRQHKLGPLIPLFMWLILLTLFPLQLSARFFKYTYQGQTMTYEVLDEESRTVKTLSLVQSDLSKLVIPSTVYEGETEYTVTEIGRSSIYGHKNLTHVVIPNTVEIIGELAFRTCYELKTIEIPNSVTTIDRWAFSSCTKLTNVMIPNSVTNINEGAFQFCDGITTIKLPNSLSTISNGVFEQCAELTSVEIPNSVVTVGDYSFLGCPKLKTIEFPSSVQSIGRYAFFQCYGLISVEMPNSIKSIGSEAFANCQALKTIKIPNSITSISSGTFNHCYELTNVEIPNSVNTIGDWAFGSCKIKSIEIPNSVSSIGKCAFYSCETLNSIEIPNSVTKIGEAAFESCHNLKIFKITDGPNIIELGEKSLEFFCNKTNKTDLYIGRNWISNKVFKYFKTQISTLTIGNTVTEIPDSTFYGVKSVDKLNLGSSIKTIGANAFRNCGITNLILPPNVEFIGENAFAENDIKTISIGSKVEEIGNKAFDGSNLLKCVNIAAITPPTATDSTFSNYDCNLHVAPGSETAYINAPSCWNRFHIQSMTAPQKVEIKGHADFTLEIGDTIKLVAYITPADVTLPYIFWRSTNPAFATVDNEGNVTRTVVNTDGSGSQIHISAQDNTENVQDNQCTIIAETMYANAPIAQITIKDPHSAIADITADGFIERPNDIYNLQGVCLKRDATQEDVDNLTPGLYIIGGKKVLVK